jgi:hypothetical protein
VVSSTSIVRQELARILESRWLRESQQLSALLAHVVNETLEGRSSGLKEYALGLQVFHRPPDYDPRNDAIVRVQASMLRKRLASYYENEGRDAAVRIDVPRGGYVAEFIETESAPPPVVLPAPPKRSPVWAYVSIALILGIGIGLAWSHVKEKGPREGITVWGGFFRTQTPTIASFGVPLFYLAGQGLYVRDVHVNSAEDESASRLAEIARKLEFNLRPQEDVYTGIGDAIGTHLVSRWLERRGVRTEVANANYLGPSDIRGKNLVVVASQRFQTLLQKTNLEHHYRFQPSTTRGSYVVDHPSPGELAAYVPSPGKGVDVDYALVSLWPGESPDTFILHLSGTHTWATQAAAQFVTDAAKLSDLDQRVALDPPQGPRGKKSPHLQVLLQVEGKNNRVRNVRYATHHYLTSK